VRTPPGSGCVSSSMPAAAHQVPSGKYSPGNHTIIRLDGTPHDHRVNRQPKLHPLILINFSKTGIQP
jgi:hypothetical protein